MHLPDRFQTQQGHYLPHGDFYTHPSPPEARQSTLLYHFQLTCSRSIHCTGNTSPLPHTSGTLSTLQPQGMIFVHFCFVLLRKDATADLFLRNLRQVPTFSPVRSTAPPSLTHTQQHKGEPPAYRGVHCSAALFTARAKKKPIDRKACHTEDLSK